MTHLFNVTLLVLTVLFNVTLLVLTYLFNVTLLFSPDTTFPLLDLTLQCYTRPDTPVQCYTSRLTLLFMT